MKYLIGLFIGLCFSINIDAQQRSDSHRPAWINGDMPKQTNHSYWFKQMYGEGKTLLEARQNATIALLGDLMKAKGFTISGNELEKILSINNNKEYDEKTIRDYSYNIEYGQSQMSFQIVDEYWEFMKGSYICYILCEIAHNPNTVKYDPVLYTTNYGGRALLRSILIPGWGQMHKKQTAKGLAILGTEVVSITGLIVSQNQYKSYKNKASKEFNPELRNSYQNKSTNWGNIRNGFIIGTSAIYLYNLIDVLASKGAKRYANKGLAMSPFVDYDNSLGLSLSYRF